MIRREYQYNELLIEEEEVNLVFHECQYEENRTEENYEKLVEISRELRKLYKKRYDIVRRGRFYKVKYRNTYLYDI